ncbi:MAG: sodium ion-translocating decarboxylase subunit beta, partial [Clostridia bacterium]|nr:sodium ion-translocating decarboxylase subunit beta [Clostridia bacterium]
MEMLEQLLKLFENFAYFDWKMLVMWAIGGTLIFLAIKKEMEPSLLLPMGFGAILINLPNSGAKHIIDVMFRVGIDNEFGELMPLILFIGIGAMIDFTPLLTNPKLMLFGAAAQFGIFFTLCLASLLG